MNKEFGIHFGALADDIAVQIKAHNLKYDEKQVKAFQSNADAIMQLRFADLLSDSVLDKVQKKLYRRIVSHVCKVNKVKQKTPIKTT